MRRPSLRGRPVAAPRLAATLLAVAASALAACGESDSPGPPSVLLLTLDTTRADALGCYGRTRGVTPHLDRLRQESALYTAAYTVAPLTLPAHASMLTGLYPPRHGVRDNGLWALPPSAETLAERAAAAGYQTAAFLASSVLGERFGLGQGFERYDAPGFAGEWQERHAGKRPAASVVAAATDWLARRDPMRPYLLWVHLFDAHSPYLPPATSGATMAANPGYPNARYLGEVAAMDAAVGALLAAVDADGGGTLVLVVADHGESLMAHGEATHGAFCYEETLRVPLLLRLPGGRRAGAVVENLVSVADVHPTLIEAMGLPSRAGLDGVSLLAPPAERGVYFECYAGYLSYGWSPIAGWRDAAGKYMESSDPELYDLRADPGEAENLVAARADEVDRYRGAIAAVAARSALSLESLAAPDEAMLRELQKLGYAGVGLGPEGVPHPLAETGLPSPVSMLPAQQRMQDGIRHASAGDFAAAEAALREVLAVNARNYVALDLLSFCLMEQDRHAEAIAGLQWLVREGPAKPGTWFNLGVCLHRVQRLEEAAVALRRAVELAPDEPRFSERLAVVLGELGRAE